MRGFRGVITGLGVIVAAAGLGACNTESSESSRNTPGGATTVVNSALQTDKDGKTVETEAAAPTATDAGPVDPAAEAGVEVFAGNCEGCHPNGGQDAGAGPVLAGKGLVKDNITTQVAQGGGAMPAFGETLSEEELTNVVAYVTSIQ